MSERAERRFLARERQACLAYPNDELRTHFAERRQELQAWLGLAPDPIIGRKIPSSLGNLREQLTNEALIQLFEANPDGWQKLHACRRLEYWEALVYEHAFQLDTRHDRFRRGLRITAFSSCLLALFLGARDTADALMTMLVGESHDMPCLGWSASSPALTFQAKLFELTTGERLDLEWKKLLPLGRYAELLDPELKGDAYLNALDWACNEHLQGALFDVSLNPFVTGGFAPMPIELMMWRRYRRTLGLEHSTQGHPLLETELARLDPPPPAGTHFEELDVLERSLPHLRAYLATEH